MNDNLNKSMNLAFHGTEKFLLIFVGEMLSMGSVEK